MSGNQHSLLILLWNSNGLAQHTDELDVLLHEKRIDLALVTETHFTDHTHFGIKDYTVYSTNYPGNIARGVRLFSLKTPYHTILSPHLPINTFNKLPSQLISHLLLLPSHHVTVHPTCKLLKHSSLIIYSL